MLRLLLSYTELTTKNIEFRFDEYGLLHLKFVNLKGQVSGTFSAFLKPIPVTPVNPIILIKSASLTTKPIIPVKSVNSIRKGGCIRRFRWYNTYRADLSNIAWEEIYAVESTKKADGKYDVKFKSMTESSITYNILSIYFIFKRKQ